MVDLNRDQEIFFCETAKISVPARIFNAMNRDTLRMSHRVIALGRFMRTRMLGKAAVADRLTVIPPGPHEQILRDATLGVTAFRKRRFPTSGRLVMCSGNHGLSTLVQPILAAAEKCEAIHVCTERSLGVEY